MRKGLLRSSQRDFVKIRNFMDNVGPIMVQTSLDGAITQESNREAEATRERREYKLEKLREDARFDKEFEEDEARSKALDPLRGKLHDLDLKLNELSKGRFFGTCAFRGLETYTSLDLRKLWKQIQHPEPYLEFFETLKEAVRLNRDFYLQYHGIESLGEIKANEDISMHNIAMMCKWLGIRPDRTPELPATFFD